MVTRHMKKLINEPSAVVDEMLDGMVAAHPDEVRRLEDSNVLVRRDAPVEGKVAVVSGGGSGHEPTHAGYLGPGMLDGAAAGEVFTSPTADEVSEMVQACDGGEGVLMVIKNYEGDVMNFETAGELAEMESDVDVAKVVVNDDVAVEDSLYTSGRRGVCGTIFVHKVAGAMADEGGDLDDVQRVAQKVIDNVATMGTALTSCITPEKGEPTFDLGEDEIELGIGIHGEPGVERVEMMSADEITERLTENVLDDLDPDEGAEVATIVNGMGGTPLSELYIVNRKLQSMLDDRGLETWDAWVGDYMTSLDMQGCSVTVLVLDDELKELLAHPVETPALTVT
ncbi:dihydroxyacetone kinase DhaK subunit [Haladaptatus paucihalophilus DX253]|uniref:Dihydroxyacetone kinase DhaK subunit n=2 Tax=Haladaptatus paucihalophilus DX253 TaxID=797209 RepID=A0A1M6Z038_HALPU|nr:dihydroxyacetone kinase DhaK subunit [Haladaptatus paucihalophilus DX253]